MTGPVSDKFTGKRPLGNTVVQLQHSPYNKLQKSLSIPRTRKEKCQTRGSYHRQCPSGEANSSIFLSKSDLPKRLMAETELSGRLLRLTFLTGAVRNVRRVSRRLSSQLWTQLSSW
jgi:hypothetical protein